MEDLDQVQIRGADALAVIDEAAEIFAAWARRKQELRLMETQAMQELLYDAT
jgi:heme oxygenase